MAKNEWEEVQSPWIKWGKEGDNIFGTLIAVREQPNRLQGGEMQKIYDIKADGGSFHNIVDKEVQKEPTEIEEGEIYIVGGKTGLDKAMRNIQLGSKIKLEYVETHEPKQKGHSPFKLVKVFTNGKMDEEWLENQKEDSGDAFDEVSV